mmetsp:Transcript_141551/g.394501  ORF Transcript_141551/g.394501 Transcript_141551/m.394501 type:complete len:214 (+) Transcript_141551:404-1045(+)
MCVSPRHPRLALPDACDAGRLCRCARQRRFKPPPGHGLLATDLRVHERVVDRRVCRMPRPPGALRGVSVPLGVAAQRRGLSLIGALAEELVRALHAREVKQNRVKGSPKLGRRSSETLAGILHRGYAWGVTAFDLVGCSANIAGLFASGTTGMGLAEVLTEAAPFLTIVGMHGVLITTAIVVVCCPQLSSTAAHGAARPRRPAEVGASSGAAA